MTKFLICLMCCCLAACAARSDGVSYSKQIQPIFEANCVACHKPAKKKGRLDLTSYKALAAGGKAAEFVPGDPAKSYLIDQISGKEPDMPQEGDPLKAEQIKLIAKWIEEGAKDDTPVGTARAGFCPTGPLAPGRVSEYWAPPVVDAIAFSPEGSHLAVGGRYEVLIYQADGSKLVARVPSGSPRTTTIQFSADGKSLLAAGGAPGQFGQVQVWETGTWKLLKNYQVSGDTIFGLSISPAGDRVVFGCADRSVRVVALADGREILKAEPHTDWAFGAVFTMDGQTIVSVGRDKNAKRIELSNPLEAQDLIEPVEPMACIARHPTEDRVLGGSANGLLREYRIGQFQKRAEGKEDPNRIRELERQNGSANAIAFSQDGKLFAVASTGQARIYKSGDGTRVATLAGSDGPVYAVAFNADGSHLATAGYDGQVRIYETTSHGKLTKTFIAVPLHP